MRSRHFVDRITRSVGAWQRQCRQLTLRIRESSDLRVRRAVAVAGMGGLVAGLLFARVVPSNWFAHERAHVLQRRQDASISVYFSPRGRCTDAVVTEVAAAKSTIFVQAYSFTSAPIAKALIDSHRRGVDVRVILDKGQRSDKYSSADFFAHAGIPTMIDARHAIAHNKVMIVDGKVVITGSFNFTEAAEQRNAENLLVIRDKLIADEYTTNWEVHAAHSGAYLGR